jgi:hypothetical protein
MSCLAAYFDKGGDVDEPVIVVAGFIAEPMHWDLAGNEWRWATGMDDFHMSDLTASQKDDALKELVRVVSKYLRVPITTGVYTKAFSDAALGSTRNQIKSAYSLCCLNCIIAVSKWAIEQNESPVDLVFDRDGKFYNDTSELYRFATTDPHLREKFKIGGITQADRKRARGIQLADALAHTLFGFHRERINSPSLSPGPHLSAIMAGMPKDGWLFTKPSAIEQWAELLASSSQKGPM